MHFDDGAVGSLQEDLIPAAHGPASVIGEWNILVPKHRLERLYIIHAKRDVAAFNRVQALLCAESDPEILLRDMKLRGAVGEELDLVAVAVIAIALFGASRHRFQVEH